MTYMLPLECVRKWTKVQCLPSVNTTLTMMPLLPVDSRIIHGLDGLLGHIVTTVA